MKWKSKCWNCSLSRFVLFLEELRCVCIIIQFCFMISESFRINNYSQLFLCCTWLFFFKAAINKVLGREEEVPVTHRAASCNTLMDYYWGMLNYFSSFLPDYCVLELQNNTLNEFEMDDWILYMPAEHCRSRIKCFKNMLLYTVVYMTCQDIHMLYLCCEEWS